MFSGYSVTRTLVRTRYTWPSLAAWHGRNTRVDDREYDNTHWVAAHVKNSEYNNIIQYCITFGVTLLTLSLIVVQRWVDRVSLLRLRAAISNVPRFFNLFFFFIYIIFNNSIYF